MTRAAAIDHQAAPGPSEATVVSVTDERSVRLEAKGERFDAKVATVGEYRPRTGDRVLALRGEEGAWVLGVLGALRPVEPRVRTRDGVEAAVDDDGCSLAIRDARGALLFTHDARTGRSTIHGDDLRIAAEGELSLSAARAVRIAGEEIALEAPDGNALELSARGTELRSSSLRAELGSSRVSIGDAVFAAERVESAVKKARHVFGVAEVRAQRLVERTRDVFREVEGVSQTRAGRIRTVARAAYSVLADRATVKAETDMHLMGEKIHLA